MANATITAWLRTPAPHYETGVALYEQFGTSSLLKVFFSSGKGNYHLSRLKSELSAVNDALPDQAIDVPMVAPPPPPKQENKKIHSLTDSEWDKAPERIKDLYTENHQLKGHAELLHHQIRVAPTAGQRLGMAMQLLEDRDRNNKNWAEIRKYQETGKVAEEIKKKAAKAVTDMSVAELSAIVRNLPSYISRDTKRMNVMADGPRKEKLRAKIAENQVTLDIAKERLSGK